MNRRRKYVPDLSEFMSQCEINYVLMMRLVRVWADNCAAKEFKSSSYWSGKEQTSAFNRCQISSVDESRYTSTYELYIHSISESVVKPVQLKVRLYHDAHLAEVLEENRNHIPTSNHEYPNQVKHYPDDKVQRNQMLHQCLQFCLHHPVTVESAGLAEDNS